MKTYNGSCHCGLVKFSVTTDLNRIAECNCSICRKKGALHHRVKAEQFKLLQGEEYLTLYQFDTKEANHLFCRVCGIHSFSNPRIDPNMVSVNVRCLDDFDLETAQFERVKFDGRNWDEAAARLRAAEKQPG